MARRRRWGSLRKLPSGRWQARYPGPDGRTYPAPDTFPTKTDADIWLNDKEAEIRRTGWRDPNAGKERLADYAARWLAERPGLALKTRERYEQLERSHIRPGLGGYRLEDITPAEVRRWRARLLEGGTGEVTVAKTYRLLKTILNTAVEEDEVIPRNPCRIKGAGKERSPERPVPTIEEVYRIAEGMPERYRALVLMAAFTGLRWGELMALRRRDLDLKNGVVHVRASIAEAGGGLIEGPPKSEAGRRTVAIPEPIVVELKAHRAGWSEEGSDGRVFVSRSGGTPLRGNFGKAWRRTLVVAGVRTGLHFHDLRHCANDIAAGIVRNLREQMDFLGHASADAALRYQHSAGNRALAEGMSKRIEEAKAAKWHVGGTSADEGGAEGGELAGRDGGI